MNKLPPTLIKALYNEDNGIFQSKGHLTACKACGKMMYHNMTGSDEDLCRLRLSGKDISRTIYLCRKCANIIQKEKTQINL